MLILKASSNVWSEEWIQIWYLVRKWTVALAACRNVLKLSPHFFVHCPGPSCSSLTVSFWPLTWGLGDFLSAWNRLTGSHLQLSDVHICYRCRIISSVKTGLFVLSSVPVTAHQECSRHVVFMQELGKQIGLRDWWTLPVFRQTGAV